MFEQTVTVKIGCPIHPNFLPQESAPTRKCRCCQSVTNVYEWLRMAQRVAAKINNGGYESSVASDVTPPVVDVVVDRAAIAEVAVSYEDRPANLFDAASPKRAVSTMVEKAPDIPGKARNVRRKG